MKKKKYIIGIDEVGRGALAGPVMVAVVALLLNSKFKNQKAFPRLRDSKKLSPKNREIWFRYIKDQRLTTNPKAEQARYGAGDQRRRIFYAVSSVSPKLIDKINISNAANLAASRALARLITNCKLNIADCQVFLDGGLHLDLRLTTNDQRLKIKNLKQKTIVRGDEKIPAIALASIMAKVSRDQHMKKLHKKYPEYGFINNVGYGTKNHIKVMRKHGLLLIHRRSFKLKQFDLLT